MYKRIFMAVVAVVIVIIAVIGFKSVHNTPEAAAKRFTNNLSAGKTDDLLQQMTPQLTKNREAYWRSYFQQFTEPKAKPTLGKSEKVVDSFNTYDDSQKPQRITYVFHLKDKDYQVTMILIKDGKTWRIDELQGADLK
jgi:predicted metalloprotease